MVTSWNESDETTQVFDNERIEGAASGSERWYISPDGKSKEVLAAREIIERARAGSLSDSTLVWRDGLTDWTRLDAVPELMQAVRAFRGSVIDVDGVAPTVVIESHVDKEGADKALPPISLPPLPALPGAVRSSAPLPGIPVSPRPPTQTLSGAPLPPPPSLPPTVGRTSVPDSESDPKTRVVQAASSSTTSGRAGGSLSGGALAGTARRLFEEARPIVASYTQRTVVYLGREYDLPRVGKVSGWLLAGIGAGVVLFGVLMLSLGGDDEPNVGADESESVVSGDTKLAGNNPPVHVADEESGVDLDEAEPRAPGQPEAVSLSDLKSLGPGEKPPEVAKAKAARSTSVRATKGKEFDVYAAKSALSAAATKAAQCKQGPKGDGSVRVKIAPTGRVSSVSLMTPAFQGTAAGTCVEQVFGRATIPAFSGEETTVFKKFSIQ